MSTAKPAGLICSNAGPRGGRPGSAQQWNDMGYKINSNWVINNYAKIITVILFFYVLWFFLIFFGFLNVPDFIIYLVAFFISAFLPDLWFIYINKPFLKRRIRHVLMGKYCDECKKDNKCDGLTILRKNECDKFDIFATILGMVERVFVFLILLKFGLKIEFFQIIGAWLTLRVIGDYWTISKIDYGPNGVDLNDSQKKNETSATKRACIMDNEIIAHSKRASFNLFMINNLVSIGCVILIFYITTKLLIKNYNYCLYWC